jgi:hypothetical protein
MFFSAISVPTVFFSLAYPFWLLLSHWNIFTGCFFLTVISVLAVFLLECRQLAVVFLLEWLHRANSGHLPSVPDHSRSRTPEASHGKHGQRTFVLSCFLATLLSCFRSPFFLPSFLPSWNILTE